MHIANIKAQQLKGRSFGHDLAQLTLIHGRNFRGKTSIIEACRLALLGRIPEIGSRNQDAFELAGGPEMRVEATFSNRASVARTFRGKANSEGKVSVSANADVSGEIAPEELEEMPALDSAAYFSMTESDRLAYVFQKARLPEDYKGEALMKRIDGTLPTGNTDAEREARHKVIGICSEAFTHNPVLLALTLLTGETGELRKEYTFHNRAAKESEGAIRTLTDLKTREGECSAETLGELDEELHRLSNQRAELSEKYGALNSRAAEVARQLNSRRLAEQMLNEPVKSYKEDISRAEARLAEIKSAIVPLPQSPDSAALETLARKAGTTMSEKATAVTRLKSQLESIEEERRGIAKHEACPYCKSKKKGWQDEILKTLDDRKGELSDPIASAEKEAAEAAAAFEAASKAWKDRLELERAQAERNRETTALQANIGSWQAADQSNEKRLEAARQTIEETKDVKPLEDGELQITRDVMAKVDAEIKAVTDRRDAAIKLRTDLQRAAQAGQKHESHKAMTACIKAAGDELKNVQKEMIEQAFRGILDFANNIVGNLLISPLDYHQGEIGRWDGYRFVKHRTFSGTEKALCYVAIAAALSHDAPFRIVLLDEMGRLDRQNKDAVMKNLSAAVARGDLDQVIAIDTEAPSEAAGWTLINLDEEKAA